MRILLGMSGGLDSQLAVKLLQRAGAEVEAVCFNSPFFDISEAEKAAAALGIKEYAAKKNREQAAKFQG